MKWTVLFLLLLLPFSSAHLDSGEDVVVNSYLVDMGYTPAPLLTETLNTFSFNLADPSTQEVVSFDRAFIRISGPNGVEYSGYMAPDPDHVVFSYSFVESGSYGVLVEFEEGEDTLASYTFTVEVEKNVSYLWASLAVLVLLGLYFLYRKKRTSL